MPGTERTMQTMVVNSGLPEMPDLREQRGLGPDLRRAWIGYRVRLLAEMKAAGFSDTGFPDGRILRICLRSEQATISQIARELNITRQGAGKAVASLRERGYIRLTDSTTDGREKIVTLTERAMAFLDAHRKSARKIERQLRAAVGADGFEALSRLLLALADESAPQRDTTR
jgi:DNA-binding MarR family transcriptional regulator